MRIHMGLRAVALRSSFQAAAKLKSRCRWEQQTEKPLFARRMAYLRLSVSNHQPLDVSGVWVCSAKHWPSFVAVAMAAAACTGES